MTTLETPQVRLPHTIAYRQAKRPRRGELEHRTLGIDALEFRQSQHHIWTVDPEEAEERGVKPEQTTLLEFSGYASLFGRSYGVGPYTEEISRGAFKRSLGNPTLDVVLRLEHGGPPLARTTGHETLVDGTEVPTLTLTEDDSGLHVDALLDPTDPDVQRLVPKYRRGDLKEMSFAFRVGKGGDEWSNDFSHRTVNAADIHRGDVSIVTYGASPTTASTLRSEELANELRSVGPEGLIGTFQDFAFAWVAAHMAANGQRKTLDELEARVGKTLSSDSLDTLQRVLALTSNADDAVGEAQVLLSDLMGTPNPDDEGASDDNDDGNGDVTSSEQLDHTGRSAFDCRVCTRAFAEGDAIEVRTFTDDGNVRAWPCHADCEPPVEEPAEERDDPTGADYGINCDLKQVKMALAMAKASQLQDPDLGTDSDDAAVLAALEAADAEIDKALVAQGSDLQSEDDDDGASLMAYLGEGDADLYWRKDFTDKERADAADSGEAMPDGSFPIRNVADLKNAIQAVGRAKDPAAAKAHIKTRAKALGESDLIPEDWRSAPVIDHRMNLDEAEFELRAFGSKR